MSRLRTPGRCGKADICPVAREGTFRTPARGGKRKLFAINVHARSGRPKCAGIILSSPVPLSFSWLASPSHSFFWPLLLLGPIFLDSGGEFASVPVPSKAHH